jgi:signal transduction histidine kinase
MPPPADDDLNTLYLRALGERVRRQGGTAALAERLQAAAGGAPRWLGRAMVLQAAHQAGLGQLDAAEALLAEALEGFERTRDAAGVAACRDLQAGCRMSRGDTEGAWALMQRVLELPAEQRAPIEWCICYGRTSVMLERLGRFDEALRWHYRTIAAARDAGDRACEAMALGAAGGFQFSLHNLEDAASLCESAWCIVDSEGREWTNTWSMVAVNWLMVLHLQGRYDAALPLAETIVHAEPRLPPVNAAKRRLLLAGVFTFAGQPARAQALLEAARALSPAAPVPPIEWSWTQARLWNQAGRHVDALQLCDAHLRAGSQGKLAEADLPYDVIRLHTEAAAAQEALGDLAAALRSQRAITEAERAQVSAATRARRLTLQIQFQLESAQRERDAGLRREQDAAREQQRLAELNAALRDADLAKSRFLAAASHDLRQPIHALGLQLAHLRTRVADAESLAIALRMERAVGSLTSMFNTLLDISRMDAGVVAPRRHGLALRPFMAALAEEFAPLAQTKGLRLALRVAACSEAPHTDTDPDLLGSLLRNLLANAIKYTERGGVLFVLRPCANAWRLQVWDSGPGIAPQDQQRVFEEFYRIGDASRDRDRASASASGSIGLGLAIVKRLSRLLDHPLRLRSHVGRGSCFSVDVLRAEPRAAAPPETPEVGVSGALCVAVIEDDVEVRESLASLLRCWGHAVFDGADADAVLRGGAPTPQLDAVIADYRLQGKRTGIGEVQRLHAALGPGAAALIVTGDTAPERLRELADCGLPWLSKPVHPARLRSWLGGVSIARSGPVDRS